MNTFLQLLNDFGLTFVPIFVAMDIVGAVPIVLPFTMEMEKTQRSRVTRLATITGGALGIAFVLIGRGVFSFMGIEIADFLVGGGSILFLLAARELVMGKLFSQQDVEDSGILGVVPLGTPLLVGPAVLTTLLILIGQFNIWMVLFSFVVNLAIAWLLLDQAARVAGLLGKSGLKAISKIIALFLAAIAVKMIREGIVQIIS
jgi:multiple antibiotic resistance protein